MFDIFFSVNVSLDIFKQKEKLKEIKIPDNYNLISVTLDYQKDQFCIMLFGKSLLYKRQLKFLLNDKIDDISIIKIKIEEKIKEEIKVVNDDLNFVNMFSLLLSKTTEKENKNLINLFKDDLTRFEIIMEETYRNTYQLSKGTYETILWKPIIMKQKKR